MAAVTDFAIRKIPASRRHATELFRYIASIARKKQIYRITYPNGKISVGMDLTGTLLYFGGADSDYVMADSSPEVQKNFTIRKEVLWESDTAADNGVRQKEVKYIRELQSMTKIRW